MSGCWNSRGRPACFLDSPSSGASRRLVRSDDAVNGICRLDNMPSPLDGRRVETVEQLESLYGTVADRSLIKEVDHITERYREFLERSPFAVVATVGPDGLDCSPRGDPEGVVRVVDQHTVMMPDRRGNNRLDTLRNLLGDPRISLLFLIPGIGETMRINGRAEVVADPELCGSFSIQGKTPQTVLVIHVERIYFQCQKALVRSQLWEAASQAPRQDVPTAGEMLGELTKGEFDGRGYDSGYPDYMKKTIY